MDTGMGQDKALYFTAFNQAMHWIGKFLFSSSDSWEL